MTLSSLEATFYRRNPDHANDPNPCNNPPPANDIEFASVKYCTMSERHYSRSDTSHMAIHTSQTDLNCWVIFQAILFRKGKAQIISMQLYPHNECTNKSSCKRNTWQGMVLETKRYRWSVPCFHSDRAPSTKSKAYLERTRAGCNVIRIVTYAWRRM